MTYNEQHLQRFLREARAVARLNHPNIVSIYAAGQDEGTAFLALELVRGGSLVELRERVGPELPVRLAAHIMRDSARGLGAAHAAGIVHRDVKPGNILLSEDQVKLTDFGIARVARRDGSGSTESGAFVGTPRYSSPEQCMADEVDGRSDLYSLAVVTYELLTGAPPHTGPTPLHMFRKICHVPAPPIRERRPETPPALAEVVDRLLAKKPEDRFASASDLLEALEPVVEALEADTGPALEDVTHDVIADLLSEQPTQLPSDVGTIELAQEILRESRDPTPRMVGRAADSAVTQPTKVDPRLAPGPRRSSSGCGSSSAWPAAASRSQPCTAWPPWPPSWSTARTPASRSWP